jgi:uncharacterized repeat protein (TIGR03847 family)
MPRDITPEVFTADYVGEPGKRAFFLQCRSVEGTFTVAIEKEQVAVLAEKLGEVLLLVDREDAISGAPPERDPALDPEPMEPEWRVGSIGLGYEESLDMIAVLLEPFRPEEEEGAIEEFDDEQSFRLMLRRDQVRAFILHTLAVVAEGRPVCRLCGLPKDPEGHVCPASNGHKTSA